MKGAAMKAGQLLSIEGQDFLPPEVMDLLAKLHDQAPALSSAKARELFVAEFGEELVAKLSIEATPIAAASIGQVHRASWQGEPIVLKLQYPGVAASIDSDVALLQSAAQKMNMLAGKRSELNDLFDEIRLILHQETDYLAEALAMKSYRANFRDTTGLVVPAPIEELCRKTVLAMSYHEGVNLKLWAQSATPDQKQIVGERLMQLFIDEYLTHGLVQTDPNWGNFLVNKHGELVALDFGATKTYSPEFRHTYRRILTHTMRREKAELLRVSEEFGLIDAREGHEAREAYVHMMDVVLSPFRHQGVFHFAGETYSKDSREATMEFARKLKFSPPPRQLIFLHRKLGGVFQGLKRLEAKLDLGAIWREHMELK
jgi:aarF domain-containing kinase